jgi:hypothetical protein
VVRIFRLPPRSQFTTIAGGISIEQPETGDGVATGRRPQRQRRVLSTLLAAVPVVVILTDTQGPRARGLSTCSTSCRTGTGILLSTNLVGLFVTMQACVWPFTLSVVH